VDAGAPPRATARGTFAIVLRVRLLRVAALLGVPVLVACGPAFSSASGAPTGAGGAASTATGGGASTSTGAGGGGASTTGSTGSTTGAGGGCGAEPLDPCATACDSDVVVCGTQFHCGACLDRFCLDGACACPGARIGVARHLAVSGQHCFDSALRPKLCAALQFVQIESTQVFFVYATEGAVPGLVPLTFCGPKVLASSAPALVASDTCPVGSAEGVTIGYVLPAGNGATAPCGAIPVRHWQRGTPADHVYVVGDDPAETASLVSGGYEDHGPMAFVFTTAD
jgi:hypothetical protein